MVAQRMAVRRRARRRKLVRLSALREAMIEQLKEGWSPEQIAGGLLFEGQTVRVCQETIYRHVYSKDGLRSELWWHLPNHRMRRRPRRARKRRASSFAREVSILFRTVPP